MLKCGAQFRTRRGSENSRRHRQMIAVLVLPVCLPCLEGFQRAGDGVIEAHRSAVCSRPHQRWIRRHRRGRHQATCQHSNPFAICAPLRRERHTRLRTKRCQCSRVMRCRCAAETWSPLTSSDLTRSRNSSRGSSRLSHSQTAMSGPGRQRRCLHGRVRGPARSASALRRGAEHDQEAVFDFASGEAAFVPLVLRASAKRPPS